jgi:hypothetical protein
MSRQVTCITIDDGSSYDDCRCIEYIGYENNLGNTITKRKQEVHDDIKDGKDYYILHNGTRTQLEAAGRGEDRYVRTEPNDTERDNLLNQPRC